MGRGGEIANQIFIVLSSRRAVSSVASSLCYIFLQRPDATLEVTVLDNTEK